MSSLCSHRQASRIRKRAPVRLCLSPEPSCLAPTSRSRAFYRWCVRPCLRQPKVDRRASRRCGRSSDPDAGGRISAACTKSQNSRTASQTTSTLPLSADGRRQRRCPNGRDPAASTGRPAWPQPSRQRSSELTSHSPPSRRLAGERFGDGAATPTSDDRLAPSVRWGQRAGAFSAALSWPPGMERGSALDAQPAPQTN